MIYRSHGKEHGRGVRQVQGPHSCPGGREAVAGDVVGVGRRRKTSKVQKPTTPAIHAKRDAVQTIAYRDVKPGTQAVASQQSRLGGLAVSLTENRAIRTLTTNWKEIALITVGTSLAVVGAAVTFSTIFFWVGVTITVAGSLMMFVGVTSMGRNAELLKCLFSAERKAKEVREEAQRVQGLAAEAQGDVGDVEDAVNQNEKILEEEAAALKRAQEAAEALKLREAEVNTQLAALSAIMQEINEPNAAIAYLGGCIDRVAEDLQSSSRAVDDLHETITRCNGDVYEMSHALYGKMVEYANRLEELESQQLPVTKADVKEYKAALRMIESILQALVDEQAKIIGLEGVHLKMKGQFDALKHMSGKLQQHHEAIQAVMSRAHEQREEIRKSLEGNASLVRAFNEALREIDDRLVEFSQNDSIIGARIQHLGMVMGEIDEGLGQIETKARETVAAVRDAKDAAGAGYVDALKQVSLVIATGVGGMAVGPVVGMAGGAGLLVYYKKDEIRAGMSVICGVVRNPFK